MSEDRVLIAEIGAPHGVRGQVRLRAFSDDPHAITEYGPLETEDRTRRLTIRRLRPGKGMMVADIEGVTTRDEAEALKNRRLYVARARLPEPGDEAWYHVDLVGLQARDASGRVLGSLIAVQDFGAGDLLEIRLEGSRRTVLVPFTREVVPVVDVAGGHVVIDPPAGLLDEPDAEERP